MQLMFLKLDGVRGESYAPRHIGEIEISGFFWGEPKGLGAGRVGAGKASINDLTVFKQPDKTSPFLRVASTQGQHFKYGLLTIEKVSATGGLLHSYRIEMTSINIHFVTHSDSSAAFSPTGVETVELNFEGLTLTQS